ncbi:diphosphoinositol polyphosphate phosphohydrolase 1-like [Sycon ciliatum]|uniref:diphosphoinositol polyphosphate phosphohydrolase 1-like n=1 Tax=Sycon ciliatum TaxID=27933 RepID=UPI0020AE48D1|eukprot:scpid81184/ scgid10718/ Diphosphoinositol polyphosphate phosphohydrolase 1; Diadenosine 5&apos; Nucleoside diphosphate-linked moiety X motif 3
MSQGDFCREVNEKWLRDSGERRPGKNSQMRTFDADGFRRRAGCIIFRNNEEKEILLVSSSSRQHMFIVPAGGVDPGETLSECAVREALEEAGVRGTLARFLGVYEHKLTRHRTAVFVMYLTELMELDQWKVFQQTTRNRAWFSLQEAHDRLTLHLEQKEYVIDAIATGPMSEVLATGLLPVCTSSRLKHPPVAVSSSIPTEH